MATIAIPSDVLNSMKIPRCEQEQVLKLELALALYQRGILVWARPVGWQGFPNGNFSKRWERGR
jgi:hypothetical protein